MIHGPPATVPQAKSLSQLAPSEANNPLSIGQFLLGICIVVGAALLPVLYGPHPHSILKVTMSTHSLGTSVGIYKQVTAQPCPDLGPPIQVHTR